MMKREIEHMLLVMRYYDKRRKEVVAARRPKFTIRYHKAAHELEQLKMTRDLHEGIVYENKECIPLR